MKEHLRNKLTGSASDIPRLVIIDTDRGMTTRIAVGENVGEDENGYEFPWYEHRKW